MLYITFSFNSYERLDRVCFYRHRCVVSRWARQGVMPMPKVVCHLHRSHCCVCQCHGDVSETGILLKLNSIHDFNTVIFTFMQANNWVFLKKIVKVRLKWAHYSVSVKSGCTVFLLQITWKNTHAKFYFACYSIHTEVAFHLAAVSCKYTYFKW